MPALKYKFVDSAGGFWDMKDVQGNYWRINEAGLLESNSVYPLDVIALTYSDVSRMMDLMRERHPNGCSSLEQARCLVHCKDEYSGS